MSSLTTAGRKLQQAQQQRDMAMETVRKEVVSAYEKGHTITDIAKQSGVSRPTVYAILNEERS
jgi:DNA invertase Pin-like site-specific DNA recombinase